MGKIVGHEDVILRSTASFARTVVLLQLCLVGTVAAPSMAGGTSFSGPAWSPDGVHLAFLAAGGDISPYFPPGWLFGANSDEVETESTCQLWVWNVPKNRFALLRETSGRFSRLCWSPDGASIYYSELVTDDRSGSIDTPTKPVSGVLRLFRQQAGKEPEVLHTQDGEFTLAEIDRWSSEQPACAENGLHLAVPWLAPQRILIYGLGKGQVETALPLASHPSWLPKGKQLAYHQNQDPSGIYLVPFGEWNNPRLSCPTADGNQPVVWNRGATAYFTTRRTSNTGKAVRRHDPLEPHRLELVRVSVADGGERVLERLTLAAEEDPKRTDVSLAFDESREMLYVSVLQVSAGGILETIGTETFERRLWHPFGDELSEHRLPVGAQSIAPGGRYVGFQFGIRERGAPVAVYDFTQGRAMVGLPNEASKWRALWAIAETVRRLVQKVPADSAGPFVPSRAPDTSLATRHPLDLFDRPGDQKNRDEDLRRDILRTTSLGLALVDQIPQSPLASEDPPPEVLALRLFFHYVREEYATALKLSFAYADQKEPDRLGIETPALEAIQAQCHLALGDERRAEQMVARLIATRKRQLSASDGSFERDELQRLGIDLGSVAPAEIHDPFLERLRNLLDHSNGPN